MPTEKQLEYSTCRGVPQRENMAEELGFPNQLWVLDEN